MTDFTETPYAEDFHWQLSKLIDDLMHEGMASETAILVMNMAINDLMVDHEDDQE